MKPSIAIMISRMSRLPRHHRIAHLRGVIQAEPPRSIRRHELELLLKDEMVKQLKKEMVHQATTQSSTPIGHQKAVSA